MKKIKINKQREKFNRAKKLTLCVATPVYIGLFVLLAAICAILSACNVFTADEMEIIAAAAVASYLIAATPLYVLYAWFIRKREACGCLENYDFSTVEITDSEEFCGQFSLVYHYLPDPFDSDEEVTLYGGKAIEIYAEQFADRLISLDEGDDPPFFINDMTEDERHSVYNIRKELCDGELKVTLTQVSRLIFTPNGITIGENTFGYDRVNVECMAGYLNFEVVAKIKISVENEFDAVFFVGSRIAAILKKYNIPVVNGDVLDFITADPERAFKKIAGVINRKKAIYFTLKK